MWQRSLVVLSSDGPQTVPVDVVRCEAPGKAAVRDITHWPMNISCDAAHMVPYNNILAAVKQVTTQWFVCFVASERANATATARLAQLTCELATLELAVVAECGAMGTLFMWALRTVSEGFALIGVYRPMSPYPMLDGSLQVWRGELHVRGLRNNMIVPCVALRHVVEDRAKVSDSHRWPSRITCDSSRLKTIESVFEYLSDAATQWYVRFAAIDQHGAEIQEPKLVQLVRVMIQRQLVFEVRCDDGESEHRILYLWGMATQGNGYSLLGVYRP